MDEVAVIGIGNLTRGDDAIGLLAARQIRAKLPDLHVVESMGDITELLDCFRHFKCVYIIDAIDRAGSDRGQPGAVRYFDAAAGPLPQSEVLTSSHVLGISQAIELARALCSLPEKLLIYGVEVNEFEMRQGLSHTADQALAEVCSMVIKEIQGE